MRLRLVRFWLPAVVTAIGTVIMIAGLTRGDDNWAEGGALIVSAGLSIWLLNILYRISVQGDRERDVEDDARAYFDRHGRWPDDEAPAGGEDSSARAEGPSAKTEAPAGEAPQSTGSLGPASTLPAHRDQTRVRPRRHG